MRLPEVLRRRVTFAGRRLSEQIRRRRNGRELAHARPPYGSRYRIEPLPAGLTPEQLQRYVDRMSWYHAIELGDGVITHALKPAEAIQREWDLFGFDVSPAVA